MKNLFRTITLAMAATAIITASAAAADFDHCADSLKNMGLFQGDTNGYELDRAPTRAEAATMLVRLLGKESEAKALTYSAPFTDLEDWQKPYVQYLYDNKLTTGASATTFEPEAKCDAKMYTTFLLRALGYNDANGDFSYNTSITKGRELGLVDSANCNESNFLRDHVVAMSYTALAQQPKDKGSDTLLDKLVADGAIDKTKAQPMQNMISGLKDYSAYAAASATETKMSMKSNTTVHVTSAGKNVMTMDMNMDIIADMNLQNLNKSQMSMIGKADIKLDPSAVQDGEKTEQSSNIKYYYTDGNYYVEMDGQKAKMSLDFSAFQNSINMASYSSDPISSLKEFSVKEVDGAKVYTITSAAGTMNGMMEMMLGNMQLGVPTDIKLGEISMNITVKENKATAMDMKMKMSVSSGGETRDMDMVMKCTDIKYGNDIKVTLPNDLDSYPATA